MKSESFIFISQPNPHELEGAEKRFTIPSSSFLVPMKNVQEVRLVLQQPSTSWKEFTVTELKFSGKLCTQDGSYKHAQKSDNKVCLTNEIEYQIYHITVSLSHVSQVIKPRECSKSLVNFNNSNFLNNNLFPRPTLIQKIFLHICNKSLRLCTITKFMLQMLIRLPSLM